MMRQARNPTANWNSTVPSPRAPSCRQAWAEAGTGGHEVGEGGRRACLLPAGTWGGGLLACETPSFPTRMLSAVCWIGSSTPAILLANRAGGQAGGRSGSGGRGWQRAAAARVGDKQCTRACPEHHSQRGQEEQPDLAIVRRAQGVRGHVLRHCLVEQVPAVLLRNRGLPAAGGSGGGRRPPRLYAQRDMRQLSGLAACAADAAAGRRMPHSRYAQRRGAAPTATAGCGRGGTMRGPCRCHHVLRPPQSRGGSPAAHRNPYCGQQVATHTHTISGGRACSASDVTGVCTS